MGTASQPSFTTNTTSTQPAQAPLDELVHKLPEQYMQVQTRQAAAKFAAQIERADWRMIWVQLLCWGIVSAEFGVFTRLLMPLSTMMMDGQDLSPEARQAFMQEPAQAFGNIIRVPLWFFVSIGILYLTARLLGGQGTFLAQSYVSSLFLAPLGGLVAFAAFQIILRSSSQWPSTG